MLFKKRRDKVPRCPNGHILEPGWDHCPYCEELLDTSAEFRTDEDAFLEPESEPGPAPSPRPRGGRGERGTDPVRRRAAPEDVQPFAPSPPPAPPPPAAPPARTAAGPRPSAPVPEPGAGTGAVDDLTVINVPPPAARPAAPPPPAEPRPAPPGAGASGLVPPPPPRGDVTQIMSAPVGERSLVAWLVASSGPLRGRDFRLPGGTLRIGSSPACEVCLTDDPYVSGRHAELTFAASHYVLRDLQSRNGSFVNDHRVDEHTLRDGDRVRLGQTQFVFKCFNL